MKLRLLLASGICLAALAAVSVPADAKTMKECAGQWQEMKAANQTNGMKYRDFSKQCMSEGAPPAAAPPPPVEKPAATEEKKPVSGGRQAMITRERACGAEWREAKAAGRIQPGQKWPQYWSECNKRKKAEGM